MAKEYNTLKYVIEKGIPFYQKDEYLEQKVGRESTFQTLLKHELPIIDKSIFSGTQYIDLIPPKMGHDYGGHIYIFLTSGSTGIPSKIPVAERNLKDLAYAFVDVIQKSYSLSIGGAQNSVFKEFGEAMKGISYTYDVGILAGLPEPPAISKVGARESLSFMKAIEINKGLNQILLDLLKEAQDLNPESIYLVGYPPAILREVYSMSPSEKGELEKLVKSMKIDLYLGGEFLSEERKEVIRKQTGIENIFSIYASTEQVMGIGPNSTRILLSPFNAIYSLNVNGRAIPIDKNLIGMEGELIITHRIRDKRDVYTPLINYNTHDVVKVLGVQDGYILIEFNARAQKVVHFGTAGKLSPEFLDTVLASLISKHGIGEGYFVLDYDKGIDRLTFYVYKGNFQGTESDLKRLLEEELRRRQIELDYVIRNGLAEVSVEFVDKNQIPMYTGTFKNRILKDARIK